MADGNASPMHDYDHGRRDGLRLALAILAAEEMKWAAVLGQSASWRTNVVREARHKTAQVMQKRIGTALKRLASKADDASEALSLELADALRKAGL